MMHSHLQTIFLILTEAPAVLAAFCNDSTQGVKVVKVDSGLVDFQNCFLRETTFSKRTMTQDHRGSLPPTNCNQ
ncbi:hypothetical protein LguiA_007301 [Lonicera macranthoides]